MAAMHKNHEAQPVRRHSRLAGRFEGTFYAPFKKDDVGRYMLAAERYELTTRQKGKRYGKLGSVALEVLRELLRLVDYRTGRLEPRIDTIQRRTRRSRPAVVRALAALRGAGFLDWIRRYVPTGQVEGPRVRQTSNAYRLSLPAAAARLLGAWAKAAPIPDDHDHQAQAADRARAEGAFEDSPLGDLFGRWGGLLRDREFTERSQSGIIVFKSAAG